MYVLLSTLLTIDRKHQKSCRFSSSLLPLQSRKMVIRFKVWAHDLISATLIPKLRNINLHNITRSLISWNARKWMSVVQISLLIVTFLSLISRILSSMQTIKEVNPHPSITPVCGVWTSYSYPSSCYYYATCWMLVHAYATSPGKAKWSRPHQRRWEENEFKFHSVTCYTNYIISLIHVNNTKLCNIMCNLVACHMCDTKKFRVYPVNTRCILYSSLLFK